MVGVDGGGSGCHVEEEAEGLEFAVGVGEGGDEGGVRDDGGGREGEEEAVGVGEEAEGEIGGEEGGGEMGVVVVLEEGGVDGLGEVGIVVARREAEEEQVAGRFGEWGLWLRGRNWKGMGVGVKWGVAGFGIVEGAVERRREGWFQVVRKERGEGIGLELELEWEEGLHLSISSVSDCICTHLSFPSFYTVPH